MRSVAVLSLLLLAGCTASPPDPTGSPSATADPVESSATPSAAPRPSSSTFGAPPTETIAPSAAAIDTSDWPMYVSGRYGLRIGHPPDWTVAPSERQWALEQDAGQHGGLGQERFMAPEGDVWVGAWTMPHRADESFTSVLQWVQDYCRASNGSDCSTIGDRAVPLCFAQRGCHPGLLVDFSQDVQAFFTGGEHEQRMVVVVIWRSSGTPVPGLGTAQQVLEAFLSTMGVRPRW